VTSKVENWLSSARKIPQPGAARNRPDGVACWTNRKEDRLVRRTCRNEPLGYEVSLRLVGSSRPQRRARGTEGQGKTPRSVIRHRRNSLWAGSDEDKFDAYIRSQRQGRLEYAGAVSKRSEGRSVASFTLRSGLLRVGCYQRVTLESEIDGCCEQQRPQNGASDSIPLRGTLIGVERQSRP
jgi:hypothetical protein